MAPRQKIAAVPYAWGLRPGAIIKGADSYIFVPGSAFTPSSDTDERIHWYIQPNGAVIIDSVSIDDAVIHIPITVPGVFYGQNVTIKSITVYYQCFNEANNSIMRTVLSKQTDSDSWEYLVYDDTNRTSSTASSYTLTTSSNNTLSTLSGPLDLQLYLNFVNTYDLILIGGVRVRLGYY